MRTLKYLIWCYFGLLLVEGALRKWLLPQLSNPLLIVRDPIVLLIYAQAIRLGIFPDNLWLRAVGVLAVCALVAGLLAEFVNPWVMAFGLRTDFLHLPLIFILPQVFGETDLRKTGKILLLLALPMAFLMVAQFRAGPHTWINVGAGGGGQITSAMGKIRPAATFSFISGPIYFFATVSAFVLAGLLTKGTHALWLLCLGGAATILASAVSGSRSLVGGVAVVGVAMFAGFLLHPRAAMGSLRLMVVVGVLFVGVSSTKIFSEGQTVLHARIKIAAGGEGGIGGFLRRFVNNFKPPDEVLYGTPLFGKGLGLGTNAGAGLIGIRNHFLLAEGEWARVYSESGPIVGGVFILLRVFLAANLCWLAAGCARGGRLLPLLLFGAAGLDLVNGQWGQPTSQGFAAFLSGLCLSAMRQAPVSEPTTLPAREMNPKLSYPQRFLQAPVIIAGTRRIPGLDPRQPGRFSIRS